MHNLKFPALKRTFWLTTTALFAFTSAQAIVIVKWGPESDIVGPTDFGKTISATKNDVALTITGGFDSPTQGAGYYPNDAERTPNFYAAGLAEATINPDPPFNPNYTWRISPNTTPQNILIGSDAGATPNAHLTQGIYIWTKSEFLGGFDTAGSVPLSGISVSGGVNGGSGGRSRLVIQLGSDFYVTDQGALSQSFTDPTTVTWYDYNPLTDFTDFSGSVAALNPADFEDLTAVGVYMRNSNPNRFNNVWVNSIEVTAVPEPGVYALALGLSLLAFTALRQRS